LAHRSARCVHRMTMRRCIRSQQIRSGRMAPTLPAPGRATTARPQKQEGTPEPKQSATAPARSKPTAPRATNATKIRIRLSLRPTGIHPNLRSAAALATCVGGNRPALWKLMSRRCQSARGSHNWNQRARMRETVAGSTPERSLRSRQRAPRMSLNSVSINQSAAGLPGLRGASTGNPSPPSAARCRRAPSHGPAATSQRAPNLERRAGTGPRQQRRDRCCAGVRQPLVRRSRSPAHRRRRAGD